MQSNLHILSLDCESGICVAPKYSKKLNAKCDRIIHYKFNRRTYMNIQPRTLFKDDISVRLLNHDRSVVDEQPEPFDQLCPT